MPSITLFYIFLTALFTSLVMIPPISRLAVTMGLTDRPDARKVHENEIPRLGGIAIFFAFLLSFILFCDVDRQARGFLTGAVIIFLVGLADDLTNLSPRQKFIGQTLAALAAVLIGGTRMNNLGDLFGNGEVTLGMFAIPFTIIAIVGVINSVNLLDGLDGLAGGVTVIAAGALALLAFLSGNQDLVCMNVALAGAVIGFLKYNSHPARIFMGDGGSLFLGYCLGVFSIDLVSDVRGNISTIAPLIILAVPIFDTLYVMLRRLRSGQGVFSPDRSHIHHRIMGFGLKHAHTVVVVYGLSYVMAAVAVMGRHLPDSRLAGLLLLMMGALHLAQLLIQSRLAKGNSGLLRKFRQIGGASAVRLLFESSRIPRALIKYIVMAVLIVAAIGASTASYDAGMVVLVLMALSLVLLVMTKDWGNRFLQFLLYFDGAVLIYLMANYGREIELAGVRLLNVSNVLFIALFVLCGIIIVLRRQPVQLMGSPLEFLILVIVVSVPLLPRDLVTDHHLLSVAGKSVILFTSYKLVLLQQAHRNRKIIVATLLALFIVASKGFVADRPATAGSWKLAIEIQDKQIFGKHVAARP